MNDQSSDGPTSLVQLKITTQDGESAHQWSPDAGPLTFGRSAKAGLRIPRDVLSREHARLQLRGNDIVLVDLDSRNGVKVNGQRVWQPLQLADGDKVSVGDVVIEIDLSRWVSQSAAPGTPGSSAVTGGAGPNAPADPDDRTFAIKAQAPRPSARSIDQTIAAGDDSTMDLSGPPPAERRVITLNRDRIVLGRDAQCEEVLDSLLISRLNTEITRSNGRVIVRDLNSTNGTAVNGVNITRRTQLKPGDRMTVGPFHFEFDGRTLTSDPTQLGMEIRVQGLGRTVRNRQTGKPLHLLDDVAFTLPPNSFVGLLGPSGCGKSTLMDALNGRRRGTAGRVLFNGVDLYRQFDAFKAGIGYVPQEVIFHDTLPLGEALRYGSRLRLSADVSPAEINKNIDRVLEVVGLSDRRGAIIRDLSGGQKKRVSIAIELLSDPDVLFLDEVTSGLDLGTEKEMMELFRKLADDGKTIICITHFLESLKECDKLICLMRGKLVFDGDPADMKKHFEIEELREIYGLEKKAKPEEWRQRFLDTAEGRRLDREARAGADRDADAPPKAKSSTGLELDEFFLQLRILTLRYVRLLTLDRKMLFLLILLAPLIGGMLCVYANSIEVPAELAAPVSFTAPDQDIAPAAMQNPRLLPAEVERIVDDTAAYEQDLADLSKDYRAYYGQQRMLLFGSVLAAMFLSMFAAVQEIVKELPIYFHERFVKLQLAPYLLSKLIPLGLLGGLQSALLLGTIHWLADFDAGEIYWQFPVVFMTSLVGTMMGLAISAGVPGSKDSANIAVLLMIAVVIPQILFSGGMGTLDGAAEAIGQWGVSCYWGMEALTSLIGVTPPDGEKYPAFAGLDEMIGEDYWLSLVILAAHVVVLGVLLVIFMLKKDGPEAIRRVRTGLKQMAQTAGLG